MRPELRKKLAAGPDAPGVYLMKSGAEVFYVGKAKNLRARLRSYSSGSDTRAFVALLDDILTDVEILLTATEKEALILEDQLIKKHRPRFNVKLTDDKRFLCLRLDTAQPYPRLELVRRFGRDRARYFGPYHSAVSIRESLRIINRYFQLRTCSDEVMRSRKRPCLQFQIERCPAPCVREMADEYRHHTDHVAAFLEGRQSDLLTSLERRMAEKAAAEEYELAAKLRDQIRAVERSLERQRVVSTQRIDRDVVGLFRQGPEVEIHIMRTRDGRMTDARRFSLTNLEQPNAEILADFAMRYYGEAVLSSCPGDAHQIPVEISAEIPKEILFSSGMEWGTALGQLLRERVERRVRVLVPQRGDKRRLVELAERNAAQAFADKERQVAAAKTAVDRLRRALHLVGRPERIECVDISHLQGKEIVGSVVRFESGVPNKGLYRRYKIRSVTNQDDFRSLYEVVSRRARRGLEEADLPDLIVIDGGRGQLNAARAALDDHGIDHVDLVGLAKARGTQVRDGEPRAAATPERVFVQGHKNPIVLRQNSAELFLLTRARDEAHRFAIAFHRRRRRKAATRSELDGVHGIGPKRRRALLRAFGSVARLRQASIEQIAEVVGPKTAAAVHEHLAAASPTAES